LIPLIVPTIPSRPLLIADDKTFVLLPVNIFCTQVTPPTIIAFQLRLLKYYEAFLNYELYVPGPPPNVPRNQWELLEKDHLNFFQPPFVLYWG